MFARESLGLLRALALVACANAAFAAPAPLELVAPAAGTTLAGSGRVALEWRATGGEVDFDEWEAFLSLDDGATYPFRLTPHLDAARRRVLVEIPPFATERARFLLRYGHEPERRAPGSPGDTSPAEREESVDVPGFWRIEASAGRLPSTPRHLAAAPGEPARPGDAGVAFWEEGDRDGNRSTSWQATTAGLEGRDDPTLAGPEHALACSEPESQPLPQALPERRADVDGVEHAAELGATFFPQARTADRLALHVRRNE